MLETKLGYFNGNFSRRGPSFGNKIIYRIHQQKTKCPGTKSQSRKRRKIKRFIIT